MPISQKFRVVEIDRHPFPITFRDLETDCVCDKSLPVCVCGKKREIVSIGRKPLVAGEEEQKKNSRSKCAKLRIAERV